MGEKLKRLELLKDIVQQAVERGATSIEQIHQHVADLPFEGLDKAGLLDPRSRGLRDKQARTVGAVYDAIRRINREIGQLISDQIENLEDGEAAARVLRSRKAPAKAAPRSTTTTRASKRPAAARKARKPRT